MIHLLLLSVYNVVMDNTGTGGQTGAPEGTRPGETIAPATAVSEGPVTASTSPEVLEPASPQSPIQPESSQQTAPQQSDQSISWVAAEFIAHQKSASWYGLLALAIAVLAALVFLFTRDKISTSVVIIAGIALGAYGARQPQQRQYILDETGVSIGDKYLPYSLFRSFAVLDEDKVSSISFYPLKRFGQLTTIYYHPENEDAIINLLADRLPMDDRTHDPLDRFMKRIRF